jgi:hypothetical protein
MQRSSTSATCVPASRNFTCRTARRMATASRQALDHFFFPHHWPVFSVLVLPVNQSNGFLSQAIARGCRDLEVLSLPFAVLESRNLAGFTSLRSLEITWCKSITGTEVGRSVCTLAMLGLWMLTLPWHAQKSGCPQPVILATFGASAPALLAEQRPTVRPLCAGHCCGSAAPGAEPARLRARRRRNLLTPAESGAPRRRVHQRHRRRPAAAGSGRETRVSEDRSLGSSHLRLPRGGHFYCCSSFIGVGLWHSLVPSSQG